jgi:hypothetical protein
MLVFYITIPLTVLAVLVAVVPVLRGSIRHDRGTRAGDIESARTARHEVEFWNRVLGRRRGTPNVLATPEMVDDSEIIRIGVQPDQVVETESGRSIVKRSP